MKKLSAYFFIVLFLFGCSSVKNIRVLQQEKDIRIYPHKNGSLLINLQTPSFDREKKGTIDTSNSYAMDKNGIKYQLSIKPFEVAHNHPKPTVFTSDFVWLVSPINRARLNWYNSVWSIHIVLKSERGTDIFESTFELNDG